MRELHSSTVKGDSLEIPWLFGDSLETLGIPLEFHDYLGIPLGFSGDSLEILCLFLYDLGIRKELASDQRQGNHTAQQWRGIPLGFGDSLRILWGFPEDFLGIQCLCHYTLEIRVQLASDQTESHSSTVKGDSLMIWGFPGILWGFPGDSTSICLYFRN